MLLNIKFICYSHYNHYVLPSWLHVSRLFGHQAKCIRFYNLIVHGVLPSCMLAVMGTLTHTSAGNLGAHFVPSLQRALLWIKASKCQLPVSKHLSHLPRIFPNTWWSFLWNIHNFSSNIIFQFFCRTWTVHMNSASCSIPHK